MPLILGLLALFQSMASGIGAALAYFASKFTKQILMLSAYTVGLLLLINSVIDLLADNIGQNISLPQETVDFYNMFMPDNFPAVITTIISVEVALFSFRIVYSVAQKYLAVLSS